MKRLVLAIIATTVLTLAGVWLAVVDSREDPQEKLHAQYAARLEAMEPRAEKGDARAQFGLGRFYRDGLGVEPNPGLAVKWLSRAAEKGHVGAQYALGAMYEKGEGVKQNYYRAAEWYTLAANFGRHIDAQFALGQLYFKGRGVPNDYAEAFNWYLKAARRGHAAAQYLMGAMYLEGWAVKSDYVEAYKWYTLAIPKAAEAKAVDRKFDPVPARRRLAAKMNRSQIELAERRAREWRKSP